MLVLWAYMPETRGQSLEAIEEAFKQPLGNTGGRVASLLRRWVGIGGFSSPASHSSSTTLSSQGGFAAATSGESIEMSGAILGGDVSDASALETGIRVLHVDAI